MRVIAGIYRSRPLGAPRGLGTRPTSDRLRETLFNVIAPLIEGAAFADLYAGTGAVGIEALSRGAAHVTFVESGSAAIEALRANVASLRIPAQQMLLEQRSVPVALRNLARRTSTFSLVYLDPPWEDAAAYRQAMTLLGDPESPLLAANARVIAEHARRSSEPPAESYGALRRYRLLEQGDAALSFYRREISE